MASPAKQTEMRRNKKRAKRGVARKKLLRAKGSTPKFAIHPPKTV